MRKGFRRKPDWTGDWTELKQEAGMDRWWCRWRAMDRLTRSGLLLGVLLVVGVTCWVAGLVWLVVPAALAILGVAANAAGVDSRMPGDWSTPIQPR